MEVAMPDIAPELHFTAYNSAAETDVGWPNWSPVIGWPPIYGEEEAMIWDSAAASSEEYCLAGSSPETLDYWSSTISDTTFSSAAATPMEDPPKAVVTGDENDKGVRLIHLLSAAAEALAGDSNSQQLSGVILARLKQLLPSEATASAASGTERLVAHFAFALQRLLVGGDDELHRGITYGGQAADLMAAAQLLQDMSPYVNFGYFTANQAIVEAVGGERRVHIVDFDIMEGSQWAPLMQALVSMKDVPPPSHLKITAVTCGRKSAAAVQETGRRLAAFAASIGLPLSFGQCRLGRDGGFRPAAVKMLRGEAVVFNCAIHPPHQKNHSAASIRSFLAGAVEMGARLVTVVEEAAGGGGATGGFLGRFMEEVQRYSAMWDALEAGFPEQGRAREVVERMVLGPRIAGAVEREFFRQQGEEEEEVSGWAEWAAVAGFRRVGLSSFNRWQAKLMLGLFYDGYRVEEDAPNELVLSWKSRRLVSASVWSAPPPPPVGSAEA